MLMTTYILFGLGVALEIAAGMLTLALPLVSPRAKVL